jgi:hypothetical protein
VNATAPRAPNRPDGSAAGPVPGRTDCAKPDPANDPASETTHDPLMYSGACEVVMVAMVDVQGEATKTCEPQMSGDSTSTGVKLKENLTAASLGCLHGGRQFTLELKHSLPGREATAAHRPSRRETACFGPTSPRPTAVGGAGTRIKPAKSWSRDVATKAPHSRTTLSSFATSLWSLASLA